MSSKEKILKVAYDRFYRNGYLGTSVDDIIAEAAVSKSNFYYHFKSKEDLGIAVLEQRRDDMQSALEHTLCNVEIRPKERLQRFLDFLIETQDGRLDRGGCPFGNLVAEMAEHSERFRCQLSGMFSGLNSRITELVEAGQQCGDFRRDIDAADMAALILQTTQGMLLMTKCHKSVELSERTVRLLARLIQPDRAASVN